MQAEAPVYGDGQWFMAVVGRCDCLCGRRRYFGPITSPGRDFEDGSPSDALDKPRLQPNEVMVTFGDLIKPVVLRGALAVILLHCAAPIVHPSKDAEERAQHRLLR